MNGSMRMILVAALLITAGLAGAQPVQITPTKLYEEVTPSLVAVQYAWADELARREIIGAGVVVDEDLVMFSIELVPTFIPDDQIKDFKIIVPSDQGDPEEVEAVFQGRDERTNMAFLKPAKPMHLKPVHFEDSKVTIGERLFSVGILPQGAAFKSYLSETRVAATLRGEIPQVLTQGAGLSAPGSPVFDVHGKAIGLVLRTANESPLLNREVDPLTHINSPPRLFVPSRDFLLSIQEPPTPQNPIKLPWTGLAQLTGLSKDVAEALDLKNKPAIQIGDVIPGTAGEKAGLKTGDIIIGLNGQPLERGDEASELPGIFRRRLIRHKVGEMVTLSVLHANETKPVDVQVTLEAQPRQSAQAKRFFAEDLGFVVRELVFNDTYTLKLPATQNGVMVALERPQGAAQSAGLHNGDVITRLNNEQVKSVDDFEKLYKQVRKDKPHEALVVVVQRRNGEDTIRIEPPQ